MNSFQVFHFFQAQFCRAYGRERRAVRQVPQVLLPLGSVLLDEGLRQEMQGGDALLFGHLSIVRQVSVSSNQTDDGKIQERN